MFNFYRHHTKNKLLITLGLNYHDNEIISQETSGSYGE